jgi:class 3 adenylate cyclase
MGVALDTHHAVIRDCIEEHAAYEVKTAGDSFMIAIGDEERAMELAIDIQVRLMKARFPHAIDATYAVTESDALSIIDDDPDDLASAAPRAAWHGLRVRIGIHSGTPGVVFDEVTKGYDYYGSDVHVAARVEGVAHGGQICCTRAFMDAQPTGGANTHTVISIGERALKGVLGGTAIFQVTPVLLSRRVFDADTTLGAGLVFSDVASSPSEPSTPRADFGEPTSEFAPFVSALFSAFRKADERDIAVGLILRVWRLRRYATVQQTYAAIAQRVSARAGLRPHNNSGAVTVLPTQLDLASVDSGRKIRRQSVGGAPS